MIPKIIHYCWLSKDKKKELPKKVQKSIESWKKVLPDYEIKLWNEETFDINSVPWVKECYQCGCASYAYASDYIRFWVLYNYGGIWLDADQLITKSLDSLLDNKMFVSLINQTEIGFGIIGAEKEHPIIKALLDSYENKKYIKEDNSLNIENIIYSATNIIRRFHNISQGLNTLQKFENLTIYPKNYFYSNRFNIAKEAYSVHLGLTSHYKKISVVMPVYNGEKYLKECIDSVLAQTLPDFEFIIVDDGSTDSTKEIIKSYSDDRIVYIKKNHNGISEALNLSIRRAIGLYIARMDADDIMYPNRLELQYNYLQTHGDIDILGSGFEWGNGKEEKEYYKPGPGYVLREYLDHYNCIGHPTVMMRKSSLMKLPFLYEQIFDGAEDQKLWITAITHGLKVYNIPDVVLYYRQHSGQVTHIGSNSPQMITNAYCKANIGDSKHITGSNSKLTVIIPFQNEGCEVEKTVTSVRATAKDVKIMLVDDCSDDNYDYKKVAEIFGCDYYRNSKNLGVAGSRNFGVFKCTTPYFVLLDAHMRFYDFNWDEKLIELLDQNPQRLITSNTVYFTKTREGIYNNENGKVGRNRFGTYAAYVNMQEPGWEYTAKWTGKLSEQDKDVVPVSCVLGAVYASSVNWWFKIGGLTGLIKYGLDEPLMSIKTWLAGGEVLLIKNWGVGHLYRGKGPYEVDLTKVDYNQLYLIHLFSTDEQIPIYEENLKKRIGIRNFEKAKSILGENYHKLLDFKQYFYSKVAKHDFNYFLEINNKTAS